MRSDPYSSQRCLIWLFVNEQQVRLEMAFPMVRVFARQWMVSLLLQERDVFRQH